MPVAISSSWARSKCAGLHPRLEREDAGDERLRHLEDPVLAHGLLALVPGGEREPLVPAEVAQEMPDVERPRLDVAVERHRQRMPDEHVLDEGARYGQRLQDAAGAGLRHDVRLVAR